MSAMEQNSNPISAGSSASKSAGAMCPCCSDLPLEACCGPVLNTAKASTPEALMRARYSAYVLHKVDFLGKSLAPKFRDDFDAQSVDKWSREAQWQGLEIVEAQAGTDKGSVEFIAHYKQDSIIRSHHEKATFVKLDDNWYFEEGEMVTPKAHKLESPKVGRNDPCTCGSGKKYKKCCGKG